MIRKVGTSSRGERRRGDDDRKNRSPSVTEGSKEVRGDGRRIPPARKRRESILIKVEEGRAELETTVREGKRRALAMLVADDFNAKSINFGND